MSNSIDFIRYLSAKQTVDDRALNRHVWDALQNALPVVDKLRVVELGAGIGTMLERMLARGLFSGAVEYVLVDENADNIQAARTRLLPLMRQHPHLEVAFITAEAFEWASTPHQHGQYDLLVANAFLDLVNLEAALRQFWALLKPNGLFYFTITFDGVSAFLPPIQLIRKSSVTTMPTWTRVAIVGNPPAEAKPVAPCFNTSSTAKLPCSVRAHRIGWCSHNAGNTPPMRRSSSTPFSTRLRARSPTILT